ncbi:hypothetical protein [Methylobacterium nodulans]|uniref:Uncharacterized protein n=1 Tax=Methylobacterium nodulans (strain LMG 21967 / CNCM I-2342 / ORS 2060) TaxID=460265 RepID=B8IFH6_METNO|nr:hypothetical protein [Methylobacterium nodulans]ACL57711.1 conserved hypothetical protein [Methylobacterium nodulans ORS 2060]
MSAPHPRPATPWATPTASYLGNLARAAYRTFRTPKTGPTLYDLCDPILKGTRPGNAHLRLFYKVALANPLLRPLLGRAGLPTLRDEAHFRALQQALLAARDHAAPDWRAVGAPLAALLDEQAHARHAPLPNRMSADPLPPGHLETLIRRCAGHLLGSYRRNGFIPAYGAFNLIGDPDFRGRDLLVALDGLQARTYKNSTLLFNLARVFVLANPSVAALIGPPWRGRAEPLRGPVQIRHRSAYYDAFFCEALLDFLGSGLASRTEAEQARCAIDEMIRFCLIASCEQVPDPRGSGSYRVVTALAPYPHARQSRFFHTVTKVHLGFGVFVPDGDTTACAVSAATQADSDEPLLAQPLIDLFAGYQVGSDGCAPPGVAINGGIDYEGGVLTWIENASGELPYGNDLDPTLNLDVLEAVFRNHARWRIAEHPERLACTRRIVRFQRRLAETGAFADSRSHLYYLPEVYCAYFARLYATWMRLPSATRQAVDPEGSFDLIRARVLSYVRDELMAAEMNPFDAAMALLALAKLGAEPASFAPALRVIAEGFGEGPRGAPYCAYEWNKMKTPTRIIVGGPEVTSAFVLSAAVHARNASAASDSGDC